MSVLGVGRREAEPFVDELLASDAEYFEAAAERQRVDGAEIVWMPGLESLPAAAVVQRVLLAAMRGSVEAWLDRLEARCSELGIQPRLYLQEEAPALADALAVRGYSPRREVGLVCIDDARCDAETLVLRPVETAADWQEKLALHVRCAQGPDGYESPAMLWTELERRKCAAGYMTAFLVEDGGRLCGTVAAASCGETLRLKNLVVDRHCRRRGVGTRIARALAGYAASQGFAASGCFAIDGAGSVNVYTRAGFEVVTAQVEWARRRAPRRVS